MIDDSALRNLARAHGFTGTYKTWQVGERSFATVKAHKDGKLLAWQSANILADRQTVFDLLVSRLAGDLERPPANVNINLAQGTER
ncbi:hypothetical protein [Sphingobium fluviale]|uniref:Uncharacterized protein n=1 Tax=Sphingobium fluviale TaxID=2506423 RepID=A0A4Q1KI89_9SPHN|nr:hypothetical protein [Sphingobium fluviale]RXR28990.1 hypothetical protein EQG66_07885 [Sphingobium fluviale]